MRTRLLAIAFLISTVTVGVCWLSLQPVLAQLLDAIRHLASSGSPESDTLVRAVRLLPWMLGAHLVAATAVVYLVLALMVGRPLGKAQSVVDQLSTMRLDLELEADQGGPLMSRLSSALGRLGRALREEQATTSRQLAELQAANLRLSRAQTELAASERLATMGKLAAGVAHEVGNPLSGILGYLSLAGERAQDPQMKDFIQRIDAEVQRIDQIVRGLLDLGRSGQGEPTMLDPAPLIRNAAKLLGKGPDFQRVQMEVQLSDGAAVRAHSGALAQVVINLLINAAQAMNGEGRIAVRSEARDGQLLISVDDEGPGIPPQVLPLLFEPFFTTKQAGKGSGLGLAISMHLIQAMGGTLQAANRPERGARFTIGLPL